RLHPRPDLRSCRTGCSSSGLVPQRALRPCRGRARCPHRRPRRHPAPQRGVRLRGERRGPRLGIASGARYRTRRGLVKRGEIWWAEYPEPAGRRPVVIVQSDRFNVSAIATVLAVPLTSTLRLGAAPGNVVLNKRESRLSRESVANVSQLGVLPKD